MISCFFHHKPVQINITIKSPVTMYVLTMTSPIFGELGDLTKGDHTVCNKF